METLIAKLNKASEDKDGEIQSFLDFAEGWKNYQKALTEVSEMAKTEETNTITNHIRPGYSGLDKYT